LPRGPTVGCSSSQHPLRLILHTSSTSSARGRTRNADDLPEVGPVCDLREIDRSIPPDSGEIDRSVPTDSWEIDHSPPAPAGSAWDARISTWAMRMSACTRLACPGHAHVRLRSPVPPGPRACLSGPRAYPPRSAPESPRLSMSAWASRREPSADHACFGKSQGGPCLTRHGSSPTDRSCIGKVMADHAHLRHLPGAVSVSISFMKIDGIHRRGYLPDAPARGSRSAGV